jgi:ketosteroid isomerase-like protein
MSADQDIIHEFIRRINVAAAGGDGDPYALLHGDVVVNVIGTTPISGIYRGVEQARHILVSTTAERLKSLHADVTEIIGSKGRYAVLVVISAETVNGKTYNEKDYADGLVFGIQDGKISEIRVFPDTTGIETALFNNAYVPSGRLD